ncbi:MAG: hypothetical protein CMI54_02455 [Parcubacteria group bacterium]|nr:hypothetical protein [Parcubacteria group bacterium]|tara:strand:+ start:13799 stop:14374 length:576 start_codon:yes stop_codon:yes gene_type:complete
MMKVETINLSEIKPADYNPRSITPKSFEGLQKSIEKFGLIDLPVINIHSKKQDGKYTIISGHQRIAALKKMSQAVAQCVIVDFDEVKERAANIAMNNRHIQGDFERDLLGDALSSIEGQFDFEELNFDDLMDEMNLNYDVNNSHSIEEKEISYFTKTHILLSFPPDKLFEIQDHLDKILQIDGIEYEQSSN